MIMEQNNQQMLTKAHKFLTVALKWLKIISAIIMFILGLISEGLQSLPDGPVDVPQEDTITVSVAGLVPNILLGWPVSLLCGMTTGSLLSAFGL